MTTFFVLVLLAVLAAGAWAAVALIRWFENATARADAAREDE